MNLQKPGIQKHSKTLFAITVVLMAACSHNRPRPPCTWKLWQVEGQIVRAAETLPCQGTLSVDCVGMRKEDLKNLLECGAQ